VIGAEPADTLSTLDAEIAESAREATHPVREFRIRVARLTVDQRWLVRHDPRPSLDPRPNASIRHGETVSQYGRAYKLRRDEVRRTRVSSPFSMSASPDARVLRLSWVRRVARW
jgi:hypothetical protein